MGTFAQCDYNIKLLYLKKAYRKSFSTHFTYVSRNYIFITTTSNCIAFYLKGIWCCLVLYCLYMHICAACKLCPKNCYGAKNSVKIKKKKTEKEKDQKHFNRFRAVAAVLCYILRLRCPRKYARYICKQLCTCACAYYFLNEIFLVLFYFYFITSQKNSWWLYFLWKVSWYIVFTDACMYVTSFQFSGFSHKISKSLNSY